MDSLLITGGVVWKGTGFVRGMSVLLSGDSIVAVGAEDDVRARTPAASRELRLSGESVLPGVTDGHLHLSTWAKQRALLDLSSAKSLADALEMVREEAGRLPAERWVRGWNYNDTRWPEGRSFTRRDLDALGIPNPILLQRVCTHINVADGKALALSGIDSPDGILPERDAIPALRAMERNVFTRPVLKEALKSACFELASWGVTCAHPCGADDYGMEEDLSLYDELHREGSLPLRIFSYHDDLARPALPTGFGDGQVHYQGLKIFLDGSLGGRTAALSAPYADDAGETGRLNWSDDAVLDKLRAAREKGVQTMLHAIGDAALDQAIRCIRIVDDAFGRDCRLRDRINHVMVCRPDQRRALAELGLFCEIQPAFVPSDMNMAEGRLGKDRMPWAYAWRSLLDEGLCVSASSDAPVESVNPWLSLWALTERSDWEGRRVSAPEQRLTVEESIPLFTSNPNRAIGQEHRLGRIEPGFAADLIVLDRDISTLSGTDLRSANAAYVFAGGRLSKGVIDGWPRFRA